MEQYIPKDALVAEIDKGIKGRNDWQLDEYRKGYHDALTMLKKYLSTLEMKEVDLEKEIKDYFDSQPIITRSKGVDYQLIPSSEDIAKHFFELGLKAKNK